MRNAKMEPSRAVFLRLVGYGFGPYPDFSDSFVVEFCELRLYGVLRRSLPSSNTKKIVHMGMRFTLDILYDPSVT